MEGGVNLLRNIPEIETERLMKKIKLHSPNVTAPLNGKLGFFYEVGGTKGIDAKARESIEQQIPIHYSTKIQDKTELDKYGIVVAADGYRSTIAKKAGLIASKTPNQMGVGVGFTVKGAFDPELIEIWLDNYHSLHGYTYVIPFSTHEASLVSASVGETINAAIYEDRLKELAESRKWELQNRWVDFESWHTFSSYAKDGLFVVGNAGSFIDPAFGFGLKWAIQSAKLCARAISENMNYNQLIRRELLPDFESFQIMHEFFATANDGDFDKFVKRFKNPLVKRLAEAGASLFQNAWLMRMVFPKK
jgi:digeranylgeranylglycerophospholipid reductase